jgi:hypothetical protein
MKTSKIKSIIALIMSNARVTRNRVKTKLNMMTKQRTESEVHQPQMKRKF